MNENLIKSHLNQNLIKLGIFLSMPSLFKHSHTVWHIDHSLIHEEITLLNPVMFSESKTKHNQINSWTNDSFESNLLMNNLIIKYTQELSVNMLKLIGI